MSTLIDGLVWLHRWTGLAVCLLFALWFASGAVMLFVPFPSLPASARVAQGETIDPAEIAVSPADAFAKVPGSRTLRLRSRAGSPAYLIGTEEGTQFALSAVTGAALPLLTADAAGRIAGLFSGGAVERVDPFVIRDQWTVHEAFAAYRPFHRVLLADPARTVLYVSAVTGEVRQKTLRSERLLSWLGAIPHWIYFTAIREHWSLWDSLVWWASLAALLSATLGMVVGVYRFGSSRARGGSGWRVYVSWWRWHHVLGLTSGIFLLGWILSGWLSMDHGRLFSGGGVTADAARAMRGLEPAEMAAAVSLTDLAAVGVAAEIEMHAVARHPFLHVVRKDGTRHVFAKDQPPMRKLPQEWLLEGLQTAYPRARIVAAAASGDDLYARAEELSGNSLPYLADESGSRRRIYVSEATGEILVDQDRSRRAYAWIYYALHTYKIPALQGRDMLRIPLMLLLLGGGFALSLTGVVIAWRRLRATRFSR